MADSNKSIALSMTANEIKRSWEQALDKKKQLKVLAELNATTVEVIVETLKACGVDGRILPRKKKLAETASDTAVVSTKKPARDAKRPRNDKSDIQRALGIIEGATAQLDSSVAAVITKAIARIDAALDMEEDGADNG